MRKKDWNPELYLKFGKERIQPSIDLVSRIEYDNPVNMIDIGCGPGNSTQILFQRWPHSNITGVDNSPAMIEKAKHDYPNQKWALLDAGKDELPGKFDIIYSNATIQWIPHHFELFMKFKASLTDQGMLAIQLPLFFDMPLGQSLVKISKEKRWSSLIESVNELFTIHAPTEYYDLLSERFSSVEIWETDYIHIMDSPDSILEMIRSAGLRPYLDRLENDLDQRDFEAKVLANIERDYPLQKNGKILFPFKRLFFIAKKN
jgi:trans-aconitate 2-methyltransferase